MTVGIRPGAGPSDRALSRWTSRYAIALRLGSTVCFSVAAPLAATSRQRDGWLAAVLLVMWAWSAMFGWKVWRHGLSSPVVVADMVVVVAIVALQRQVIPPDAIAMHTTWVLPLASTPVYILQLALEPLPGLVLAGLVAGDYQLAAGQPDQTSVLVVQALSTAALMALVRRAGRQADAVIAWNLSIQQESRAEAARRADEREQHRQLHDTILSTLTMVASGVFTESSTVLSAQAAGDVGVLAGLSTAPAAGPPGTDSLDDRLQQVIRSLPQLQIALSGTAPDIPLAVREAIAGAAAEALRNAARHADTDRAEVIVTGAPGPLTVEVRDHGRGFSQSSVPPSRRGIAESVHGRMTAAGGSADIVSSPGSGTRVILRWPR